MPSFGYVIIKNPGPDTKLEWGGLAGFPEGNYDKADDAWAAAQADAAEGDRVWLLVGYEADESGGATQIAVHNNPAEFHEAEGGDEDDATKTAAHDLAATLRAVAECRDSGLHLTSCDADGYCNLCGEQDA